MKAHVCKSVLFILWNIFFGFSDQFRISRNFHLAELQSSPLSVKSANGFNTFSQTIANEIPGIDQKMLNSKEVKDLFNKEIVNNKIDIKDPSERPRIITTLLSMLCASCRLDCECLRKLGCFKQMDHCNQRLIVNSYPLDIKSISLNKALVPV